MKFRKLVMELGLIAVSAAIVTIPSAVSVSAAETVSEAAPAAVEVNNTADSDSAEDLQETNKEEKSEWEGRLLAVVEDGSSLTIRSEAGTDAEVVGKLNRGAAADIIEKGDEWTRIVSGDVEGYVKNEYCLFEEEAGAQAAEICDTHATVKADGLRLRSGAGTDSSVLDVLDTGDVVTVADEEVPGAEKEDGWVQVQYNDTVAYVSADYVDVELNVEEAVSIEEILEEQAAARAAAAQASAQSSSSSSAESTEAVSASSDDVTLLAAIIQCEAGGESYAGQLAVGAVVMNRVKSGSFPNSISGVIYQSGQFSPVASGKFARVLSSGKISSSCYQAAREAIGGADNTGGAKYFHAGSGQGTVIGNQVFY